MRAILTAHSLLLLLLFAVASARAEAVRGDPIEGMVRDPAGEPLFSVQIVLLKDGRPVAATRTRQDGRFTLDPPGSDGNREWILRASSLGFEPTERAVEEGETGIVLILRPAPLPIQGFDVEANRDICSAGDSSEARVVWEAAVRGHERGLDTLGMASYTRVRTDTLDGNGDDFMGMIGAEPGQRGSAPLLRLSWTRRIDREGYAFRVRRTDSERSFDSWSYPPLEADFSFHFGEKLFGELNNFQFERESEGAWILRFCGRNTRRPHLVGTLEIGRDTLIHMAEWRFRTPDPDEGAGGWVRFSPRGTDNGSAFLLPMESMTWRAGPDGLTVRRAQWYDGWILAPGDSVPFLPGVDPDL